MSQSYFPEFNKPPVSWESELKLVDCLTGFQFESYTAWLLHQLGFYQILVTPCNNDQGLDVIGNFHQQRFGIQCKHYQHRLVNRHTIRATADAVHYYRVDRGIVLTNQGFTPQAYQYQKFFGVTLWGRKHLKKLICEVYQDRHSKLNVRKPNINY